MAVPGEAEKEEEEEATGWELAMKAFLPILFVACNISLADKSNWQRSLLSLSPSLPGLVLQANWRHMEICIENVRLKEWMNELGRDYSGGRERERSISTRTQIVIVFISLAFYPSSAWNPVSYLLLLCQSYIMDRLQFNKMFRLSIDLNC